jgi:ketosteroid isomerase-like protein
MRETRALQLLATLLVSTVTVGCATPQTQQLAAGREAAIADTLLSLTEAYNTVWAELDLERISEYHADDFTYYRQGVVQSASQTEFERAYHDDVATQITSYWANARETWVEVLGLDAGVVAFVFRGGVETPDGAMHDYDGALTYVYERRGGHWRIVHIHESGIPPGTSVAKRDATRGKPD